MLAADPFFSAALAHSGFDLALRLDTSGEHVLRLVDTNSGDVVAQAPIATIAGPVLIVGSDHGDVLRIDVAPTYLQEHVPGGVAFEARAGNDRLRGPSADATWYVTATNRGSIDVDGDIATPEILFDGVENLVGAALNQDTFVVLGATGIDGVIDGGFGGFDSLAFQGGAFQSVAYSATGPDAGTIDRDAIRITYAGLEPILDLADIADLVIDTGDRDDRATLSDNGKALTLAPSGLKTFETVVFKKPTNSLTIQLGDDIGIPLLSRDALTIEAVDLPGVALTVNGEAGVDEVTFAGNLTCGNLTVNAETIVVNKGVVVSAANITLHAAGAQGRSTDPDKIPLADVDATVRIDGGTLLGNDITLRADASLVSDVSNAPFVPLASLAACVSAEVAVTGKSTITATGLFTARATSSVDATVQATPDATAVGEIAVAAPVISNSAVSRLSGASTVTAGGTVTVAATTTTTVATVADGIEAVRAVGTTTAAPVVSVVTRAAIEDAAEVTKSAAIDLLADSTSTITTQAVSTPAGALLSPATLEALGAETAAGKLTDAAAIAAATFSALTRAELSTTGTVVSDGAVSLRASSDHDVTSTADARPAVNDATNGFAVAVNNTTVQDLASIGGSPTIRAAAVNIDTQGESRFNAVARSGAAGIGTANAGTLTGGFAFGLGKTVSRAFVADDATLTLDPTTDIRIAAENITFVDLSAEPEGAATIATGLGVGRSVATNLLVGETRAEIGKAAEITGGRDLTILATGVQESRVTAYAGTLAGEFGDIEDANQVTLAASAAHHATSATIGAGATSAVAGAVLVQAVHQATNILRARGDAASPNEAFATPIALNLAGDEAHATVAGVVSAAGGVAILANAWARNEVESIAGVQGADPAATAADSLVEAEIAFLADRRNLAFGGSATPPAIDPADLDTLLSNETAGMAAAIAVNLGRTVTAADIAGGADVTAAGSLLFVMATSDVDSISLATATAVNTASGVAAAISLNTQFSETLAAISGAATADGIVVQAGVPREFVSTVRAEAASGVGREVAGMSGAAAATQAQGSSAAVVGEAASLELTNGGSLSVVAASTLDNATTATPHVVDGSTVGIGASFELNSGAFQTGATIRGATIVGADDVTVTAMGIHANTAAPRAGGSTGLAAGGSVAVVMTANETFASFTGGGSPTSIAGDLLVTAVHEAVSTHSADAGSNAEDVAAGAAIAIGVAQGGGRASLGGTLDVAGSTTVSAKTISSMDADAAASSAGVAGGEPAAEAAIDEQLQLAFQAIVPAIQLDPVGGVDGADDLLVVADHGLATGDTILYAVGDSGRPIGGLRDSATYFVSRVNANRIRLHASLDDAKAGRHPIDLEPLSGPATPHALQPGLPGAVRDLFTQGRLGTGDDAVGAAAAIALNVDLHATLAAIEPGAAITSGGPVQVLAVGSRGGADRNLDAFATAEAVDSTISLGTAAAVNVSLQSNEASVAGSVSATEIRVESLLEEGSLEGDRSVRLTAEAVSGSGAGAEIGVAAALAVNLLGLELPLDPIPIDIPPPPHLPPVGFTLGDTISLPNIGCGETPPAVTLPTIPPLPALPTFDLPDVAFSKGGKHAALIRDGAVLTLRDGGDLVVRSIYEGIATATASSQAAAGPNAATSATIGVGPSVAANAVGQQTLAEIRDAVVTSVSILETPHNPFDGPGDVRNPSDIRVIAEGTHALTADAEAGSRAAIGLPAAVALNSNAATTTARLANTTGTSRIDGDLVVRATHASTTRHVGEIGAAGVGGAVALGYVEGGAEASSGMRIDVETGTVSVRAEHVGSLDADARAGQDGAAADPFGAVSSEAVESQLEGLFALAGLPEIPDEVLRVLQRASLATADGPVGAAAALSVNLDYGFSAAVLADGGAISTNAAPVVFATGDMDVDALADASSVGGTSGLGVAVAMNVDGQRIETSVGGALTAPSLRVETLTSGDGVNTFRARAFSGAGADDVGVAGAFAINVSGDPAELDDLALDDLAGDPGTLLTLTGGGRHAARIADGATVTLTTLSDLVVTTTYEGDYRAIATATPDGVDALGVGPSVAMNAVKHTALAEIGAAVVSGARDILITATGTYTTTTDAEAGKNNDGSLPAAIALTAAMNDTIARMTPAATQTRIPGDLRVIANHTATATTHADADSSGAQVGFGVAIAAGGPIGGGRAIGGPNLQLDGDVVVRANTVAEANTVATASRRGAFSGNLVSVDAETRRQLMTLANVAGIAPILFPVFDANPAVTASVDAASDVDGGADTISLPVPHGFDTGDAVVYRNNQDDTSIGALEDGRTYYVRVDAVHPGSIQLFATRSAALAGTNPLDLSPVPDAEDRHSLVAESGFDPASAVSAAADTLDVGRLSGLETGDAVRYFNDGDGGDVGGLVSGGRYFVAVVSDAPAAVTVKLHRTRQAAMSGAEPVDLDLDGTSGAAHRLAKVSTAHESMRVAVHPVEDVDGLSGSLVLDPSCRLVTGDTVVYRANGDDETIGGLADGATYYVRVLTDAGGTPLSLTLHRSIDESLAGVDPIPLSPTSDADAMHQLEPSRVIDPATAVNSLADRIELADFRGLKDGDAVVYRNGGGANIGGLTDDTVYYVDVDSIDAPKVVFDPSGWQGRTPTTILLGPTPYGLRTGDEVVYATGGGLPVGGLTPGGAYFARIDPVSLGFTNWFELSFFETAHDAAANANPIPLDFSTATGDRHELHEVRRAGSARLFTTREAAILAGNAFAGNPQPVDLDASAATGARHALERVVVNAIDDRTLPNVQVGAAAAISIAAGLPVSEAAIGAGATLVARGDVTVVATMDFDTDADADALSLESAASLGLAAAGTYSQGLHVAEIAAAASVEARSVSLRTVAADGVAYDFSATAASAAAALGGAIAGSLAANAMQNHTAARIAADATVVSATTVDVLANLRRGEGGSFENVARVESAAQAGEAAFGIAAAAGAAAAGSLALAGDTIEATIGNGASVTAGTGVTVRADRKATFDGAAAGGSLGLAAAASLGAAFGIADGTTRAVVAAATVETTAGAIDVVAANDTKIDSLSVGLAAAGILAVGGAAAANFSAAVTEAAIDGAGSISSPAGVTVRATDDSSFTAGAGSLAASFLAAAGAAVAINATTSRVDAHISGARVSTDTGDVVVSAVSSTKADAVTLGFAIGLLVAAQGSAAMNDAGNSTNAGIDGGATIDSGGGVTLSAADYSTFTATSGGTAGALLASVGLAAAVNTTANEVHAIVEGKNTRINAVGTLGIDATSTPTLVATALGAGFGKFAAVGGAIVVNESENSVRAEIRGLAASLQLVQGSVPGAPLKTADRVEIQSLSDTRSSAVAGGVAGAKFAAGSLIVAQSAIGDSAISAADGFIRTDHLDVLADAVRTPDAAVMWQNFGPITVDAVVVAGRTSGTTEAHIGSKADIVVTGGAVVVRATSTDTVAMEVVDPELAARLEISYLTSSASAESDTHAHVDGTVSAPSVTVAANAVKTATAQTKVFQFSLARLSGFLDFSEVLPDEFSIPIPVPSDLGLPAEITLPLPDDLTFDTSAVATIAGDQSAYLAAGAVVTAERQLSVKATSENTATANADLGGATLLEIVDLASIATIAGSTRMRIDSAATVGAGELTSKASATNRANAGGGSSAASGFAVALATLDASTDHAVVAQLGPAEEQPADGEGSITVAAGGITLDASSVNRATVDPPTFEVSRVRVERVLPRATAGGTTEARLGGRVTADAGPLGLTAKAVSRNVATTHAVAAEIGGFDLDLSKRAARTTHVTEAVVDAGARLTVNDGPLALSADSTSKASLDQTAVFDLTGLGITLVESEVDAGGATNAFVDEACVITASTLAATATSDNDATIDRIQFKASGVDIDLSRPRAATSHATSAFIGPRDEPQSADKGSIAVDAPITLAAHSTNDATIKVVSLDAAGVVVEVIKPEISVGGSTQVRLGGRYMLNADVEGTAESISAPVWWGLETNITVASIGLVSPTVVTRHDTEAFVEAGAELAALGRRIDLTATSRQAPKVERWTGGLSGAVFQSFDPKAATYGATRAFVGESATVNAGDLVLKADATHSPTINVDSEGLSVLGSWTTFKPQTFAQHDPSKDPLSPLNTAAVAYAVQSFVGRAARVTIANDLVLHAASQSTATTHASATAGAVVFTVSKVEAAAVSDPTVQAHLGRDAVVAAGRDVILTAESDVVSDVIADAVSGSILANSGTKAHSEAAGWTRAFADDVTGLTAGRNLTVRANATRTKADASTSAEAGGLNAAARPDSFADARPFVQAFVNGPSITAGNAADITGIALGNSTATARGVSGGVRSVGTSKSAATWRPTVDVHVAADTTLEAQDSIVVRALNNHDLSGLVDPTRRARAEATASGGGAIDVRGATADADVRARVTAEIRDDARLSARTGSIRLESKSRNETRAIADQFGGGVVSVGSTEATGDMENDSRAVTGEGVVLEAGSDITILGSSDNQADIDTEGGRGGLLAEGGAKAEATLRGVGGGHRTQARIGDGSTIASGGRFELRAENRADIRAGAEQVIGAGLDFSNQTDATATIVDSLSLAELGGGVSVEAGEVTIEANDADVHAVAISTATSVALASLNVDADATVDATVGSRAAIGAGTSVVSNGPVTLWALQGPNPAEAATNPAAGAPGFRTRTAALAVMAGGGGLTKATSTNLKRGTADVVAAAGSSITAGSLDVAAFPDRDRQNDKYEESAVTEDDSLVGQFAAAVEAVVTLVVDAFPGLFGGGRNEQRQPTPGVETESPLGRAVNTAMQGLPAPVVRGHVDFNADVTITPAEAELEIDADGKVAKLKNAVVRDADGNAVLPGETIRTRDAFVDDIVIPAGGISLVSQGSAAGQAAFAFEPASDVVTLTNRAAKNLFVNDIHVFATGAPVVAIVADQAKVPGPSPLVPGPSPFKGGFLYELSSTAADMEVRVVNLNAADRNVTLLGSIDIQVGSVTIRNEGGSILAADQLDGGRPETALTTESFIRARHLTLDAHGHVGRTVGGHVEPVFARMVLIRDEPPPAIEALGRGGVWLDTTVATGDASLPLTLGYGLPGSGGGRIDAPEGDVEILFRGGERVRPDTAGGHVTTAADATMLLGEIVATGDVRIVGGRSGVATDILGGFDDHVVRGRNVLIAADAAVVAGRVVPRGERGRLGAAGSPLKTDTTGGRLDASASGDIFLRESAGTMDIGSITSADGDATLFAAAGFTDIDADPEADVTARGIAFSTSVGAVGTIVNDVEIDGRSPLNAIAHLGIFIEETAGSLAVDQVITDRGDIRLTARDSAAAGEDLLVGPGGRVETGAGTVTLRGGDDVTLTGTVTATASLIVAGDFGNADSGVGTRVEVAGVISAAQAFITGDVDDDTINNQTDIATTIDSRAGDDLIDSGGGADTIDGGPGNDRIWAGGGADTIGGGTGEDEIYGEDGDDTIDGGEGNDTIRGGAGHDTARGGVGDDLILGNAGDDSLFGDEGNDVLYGSLGRDTLHGGLGNDRGYGEQDDDTLNGGDGDDVLDGGVGDDVIAGDVGRDSLHGAAGVDTLFGGDGDDFLHAGDGVGDMLFGGLGNDHIVGSDDGGEDPDFNDTIRFGDVISGGDGDDFIVGLGGADDIQGNAGSDTIHGGTHADRITDAPGGGNVIDQAAPTPAFAVADGPYLPGDWAEVSGSATDGGLTQAGGLEQASFATSQGVYVTWVDWRNGNTEIYLAFHRHGDGAWTAINGSASAGGVSNDADQSRRPSVVELSNVNPATGRTETELLVAWTRIQPNGTRSIEVARRDGNGWTRLANPGQSGKPDHARLVPFSDESGLLTWTDQASGTAQVQVAQYVFEPGFYRDFLRAPLGGHAVTSASRPASNVAAFDIATVESVAAVVSSHGVPGNHDIEVTQSGAGAVLQGDYFLPGSNATLDVETLGSFTLLGEFTVGDAVEPTIAMQLSELQQQGQNEIRFSTDTFVAWHEITDHSDAIIAKVRHRASDGRLPSWEDMAPQFTIDAAPRSNAGSISDAPGYAAIPDLAASSMRQGQGAKHVFLAWKDDGVHGGPRGDSTGRSSLFVMSAEGGSRTMREQRLGDASGSGISPSGGAPESITITTERAGPESDDPYVVWTDSLSAKPGTTPSRQVLVRRDAAGAGNRTPTAIAVLPSPAAVSEGQPAGTSVGTLVTTDPDAGDSFGYVLVPDAADNALFRIEGDRLFTAAVFNFEDRSSYTVLVRSTDQGGLSVEQSLPVVITNLAEPLRAELVRMPAGRVYRAGESLDFTVVTSRPVSVVGRPQIAVVAGRGAKSATYVSGSGTNTLLFRYVVARGDNAANVSLGGLIRLPAGATIQDATRANLPLVIPGGVARGVSLDALAPATPTITLGIGVAGGATEAEATQGGGVVKVVGEAGATVVAVFRGPAGRIERTVTGAGPGVRVPVVLAPVDVAALGNGIVTVTVTATDAAGNRSAAARAAFALDTAVPTAQSVRIPAARTYRTGDVLRFVVTFSEQVTVRGRPSISLTLDGAIVRQAGYVSGSGTRALVFQYRVQAGDRALRGPAMASAIALNAGAIIDAAGNGADLALSPPSLARVLIVAPTTPARA